MKRILWLALFLVLCGGGPARAVEKNGGLAISYASPDGSFSDRAADGVGVAAIFDYPMARLIDITGSLGWYRFNGVTLIPGTNIETDVTSLWEFAAGPQLDLGRLYLRVEGGYYTDFDEWGLVPNIGFRKELIDLSARYKSTGDNRFYSFRLGFFF